MQRHDKTKQPPKIERRSGQDRRKADLPPPKGRERRIGLEPRRPEVQELEITPSEWAALAEPSPPAAPTPRDAGRGPEGSREPR